MHDSELVLINLNPKAFRSLILFSSIGAAHVFCFSYQPYLQLCKVFFYEVHGIGRFPLFPCQINHAENKRVSKTR